jgi:hypothetical protein
VDLLLVPSLRDEMLTITNFTGHPSLTLRAGFVQVSEARSDWAPDPNNPLPKFSPPRRIAAQAIKGWGTNVIYSWSSGLPFTVKNSNGTISGINLGNDRPNQVGSLTLSHPTNAEWFNTAAFAPQTAGTLGDERRNQLFGPPQRNLNLSIFKNFPIREAMSLQFRAEMFNLLNQPNFAHPGLSLGQSSFGVISSTTTGADMREIQFALKFIF